MTEPYTDINRLSGGWVDVCGGYLQTWLPHCYTAVLWTWHGQQCPWHVVLVVGPQHGQQGVDHLHLVSDTIYTGKLLLVSQVSHYFIYRGNVITYITGKLHCMIQINNNLQSYFITGIKSLKTMHKRLENIVYRTGKIITTLFVM